MSPFCTLTKAGQSCEVETLTPLIHRCNKLILVGDPKQLPPTVISVVRFSHSCCFKVEGACLGFFCFGQWGSLSWIIISYLQGKTGNG